MEILWRSGLTVPSADLAGYVRMAFTILNFSSGVILKSGLLSRLTTKQVLKLAVENGTCSVHERPGQTLTNRTIANIYFKNKQKISTDSVLAVGVYSFKTRRREKK